MNSINIHVVFRSSPIKVIAKDNTTVEDVIIQVCKELEIGPVARHLFSLRLTSADVWLSLSFRVTDTKPNVDFDFRIRFNVPDLNRLMLIDAKAYDYYFEEVKHGMVHSSLLDVDHDKYWSEINGLCVLDMYRVIVENGASIDEVTNDYRKFISSKAVRRHRFFIKNAVREKLKRIRNNNVDAKYIKAAYLEQFRKIAPNYMTEKFNALLIDRQYDTFHSVHIRVNPFHEIYPGLSMKCDGKEEKWIHICSIDDLCYLNTRSDGTVEISRKNGISMYLKFHSLPVMTSFVSLMDGYYRLMVKWTFNVCKELPTPSLLRSLSLKCHGPMSGEYSYRKLEEKRSNEVGSFILRESDIAYDCYYIDVCTKNSVKPITYKIEQTNDKKFQIVGEDTAYESLNKLIIGHRDPENEIYLMECLPPSEFDKTNLLLCQVENNAYPTSNSNEDLDLPGQMPVCIDTRTLMVFKSMPKDGRCPMTAVYRSMWCKNKNTKKNVAIKVLKENHSPLHLKEFLTLTSRWAFVASNAVVKLFGVTLANPVSMVMEYLPLGQLDEYLASDNHAPLKEVDLVEASTYLANALFYLEEAGFIHGNIRCRKLLVASHTDNAFVVKLGDPGLCSPVTNMDIHWIPPEYYNNMSKARHSMMADMWAFGTTLWEIFSYGKTPPEVDISYCKKAVNCRKHLLPQPPRCPEVVYRLMMECWDYDPYVRKKPQAAMRDINQILYQVYNSRKGHVYTAIIPSHDIQSDNVSNKSDKGSDDLSSSLFSELTLNTFLDETEDDNLIDLSHSITSLDTDVSNETITSSQVFKCITDKNEMMAIVSHQDYYNQGNSISSMQSIFELDKEWNLILTGRIGEGFYGEVYRGRLEHMYEEKEQQLVAVKKMKSHALTLDKQADFDREISIMLKLEHPNIVRIRGVVQDPELCLVLEYIEHGSLLCYLKINRDRLTPQHLLKFALDVSKGMSYLVEKKLVHRDLAARNILVYNEFHVKISDFGLARFVENNNYYIFQTERDLPIKWYAPESIECGKFSHQSDVWSYGVTLYEMFSYGEEPSLVDVEQTQQAICAALKRGLRLPCPRTCPQYVFANVLTPCWSYEAKHRPTFHALTATIQQLFAPTDGRLS